VYLNFYYSIFLILTHEFESISTNYTGLIEQVLTESFATMTNRPTSASLSTLSEEFCTTWSLARSENIRNRKALTR
jgi:hypothetical protein